MRRPGTGGWRRLVARGAVGLLAVSYLTLIHPASAVGGVYDIPSSITADCTRNVAGEISAFLASVPNGEEDSPKFVRFASAGCYRVEQTIAVLSRSGIVIDGNGATFRATKRGSLGTDGLSTRVHWLVDASDHITLQNLTIESTNTTSDVADPGFGTYDVRYAKEDGVRARASRDVVVANLSILGVWGDGIELDGVDRVSVAQVVVDRTGANGFRILDSSELVIDGVSLLHARKAGWKIEPESDEEIRSVEIRNSSACSHDAAFFSVGTEGVASDVAIHDNRIDCSDPVLVVNRSGDPSRHRNWSFARNTVIATKLRQRAALYFGSVQDASVTDNVMNLPANATPVVFATSAGLLEVKNNDVRSADRSYSIDGAVDGPGAESWGNRTVLGINQPRPPPGPIKPQIGGLIDRQRPAPSTHRPVVNGYVVKVAWADLQPVSGGPIATGNAIDQALATVRALNAADPGLNLSLKLRVLAGTYAPEWAKNLDGVPMTICDATAGDPQPVCGTVGRFWTDKFRDAYVDLNIKLAALYDTVPEIREVTVNRCMTILAEPLMRQPGYPANLLQYQEAGYTLAADQQCQVAQMSAHQAWASTRSSVALNPYQAVDTAITPPMTWTDESFTESLMNRCRAILSTRCVIGNNTLKDGARAAEYDQLYARMATLGRPSYFQTATLAKMTSLSATLNLAVSYGAGMVELPSGYHQAMTPEDLAPYDAALAANASP